MRNKELEMAGRVALKVREAGGRTFFVGGYVRDRLLGRENKDIDIEVHGITPDALAAILDTLGERTEMGASFGIMGLRHCDLDIAMPRKEKATGRGHKDFDVSVDPFIGPRGAAIRRDFTINALMQDVLTGEILDFFGGREDLKQGLIRHVNDETFQEDPLRVLRGAQFAARFGFRIAPDTVSLSKSMHLDALSNERIMGETEKALLKAPAPSVFFEELRKMEQLSFWYPEVEALIGVPQEPEYHPEGDAWAHTMQVVDEAALLKDRTAHPLWFMLTALCHDLGKAQATEILRGHIHAYGHDTLSLPPAQKLIRRLTAEVELLKYVLNLTKLHMEPDLKIRMGSGRKAFMHMYDQAVAPEDLLLLSKADHLGKKAPGDPQAREKLLKSWEGKEKRLYEMLRLYQEYMSRPGVRGQDLLDAGLKPGPQFSLGLSYAHKLRLAGVERESALRQTLTYLNRMNKKKR
ncbi:MAG: tRNA nucleotidyltransferase [Clostridia bacterium]|nr:tRNA nucleotidyltransferase [Clostridia bacterium]